jgi:hypothetical protein
VLVVLAQAGNHCAQGDQARRGNDTGLAHGAAERSAHTVGAVDEGPRACHQGADRGPEPLRQAHRHGVHGSRQLAHIHAQRHGRIEHAGAVEVRREPASWAARPGVDLGGVARSSGGVVGVLRQTTPAREHRFAFADCPFHAVEIGAP